MEFCLLIAVRTSVFVILILLEEMIVGVCSRRVAELMFLTSALVSTTKDRGGSGGSANTYVNNAYYDSGSQNLKFEFGGRFAESICWWFIRYLQRFEIFDNYGNPVIGAVTGGYFEGSNTYVLNLSDGVYLVFL